MAANIVIFGATSAIAHETAKLFARDKSHFILIGRNALHLQQNTNDLKARGAGDVSFLADDLGDCSSHQKLWNDVKSKFKSVDIIVIAHGILGDQVEAEKSFDAALNIFHINTISYLSLLTIIGNDLELQKSGALAVVTSVAGDRGRKSNYIYGASKAAVTTLLQGLRNRLHNSHVKVIDIRPGFIDTPMTKHLLKKPLVVPAEVAGNSIYNAIKKGSDIAYVPARWKWVMLIIKAIPESVFKRLNL